MQRPSCPLCFFSVRRGNLSQILHDSSGQGDDLVVHDHSRQLAQTIDDAQVV